jgi:hypothetical protein
MCLPRWLLSSFTSRVLALSSLDGGFSSTGSSGVPSTRAKAQPPDDFRKTLIKKDGSMISREIGREESEMVRHTCAIPPFASTDNLSAVEMLGLADMFEGWAQSSLTGCRYG